MVGPIQGGSRDGSPPPRLAHLNGGIVLETGLQNRGLNSAVHATQKSGRSLVVQSLHSGRQPSDGAGQGRHEADEAAGLSAFELLLPAQADASMAVNLVRAVVRYGDLPLWVKAPLATAVQLAPVVVEAGAVGLVVGQPFTGAGLRFPGDGSRRCAVICLVPWPSRLCSQCYSGGGLAPPVCVDRVRRSAYGGPGPPGVGGRRRGGADG